MSDCLPLRVLMVSAEYPPMISGIADYVGHLVESLNAQGVQVEITKNIQAWDDSSWPVLKKHIAGFKPDLVHLQYMTTIYRNQPAIHFFPGKTKKAFPDVPIITTYHEFAAPAKRLMLLPVLFASDGHIVTNDHHFQWIIKLRTILFLKAPAARIPLAANVLPLLNAGVTREQTRKRLGILPGEILLVRFGIIHDISAPELIRTFDALKIVLSKGLRVKLLLAGKEEARAGAVLQRAIHERGLEKVILIRKDLSSPEISELLSASDIGLALYPDGVSEKRTAFLSLLAHGLPVIATRRGALPAELKDGKNILGVFPALGAQGWAAAIERVMADDLFRENLSREGLLTARAHDWQEIGAMTLRFYRDVIVRKSKSGILP